MINTKEKRKNIQNKIMKSKIGREIWFFAKTYKEDGVEVYSAQAAFFIMMSFFPFITSLTSLLSLTPVTLDFFENVVLAILPSYLDDIFDPFFRNNYIDTATVFSISVVFALWTASKAVQNLTVGLNRIYNIEETRSWLHVRVVSLIYMHFMVRWRQS